MLGSLNRPSNDQASEVFHKVSVEIKNIVKVVTETLALQDIQERLGFNHRTAKKSIVSQGSQYDVGMMSERCQYDVGTNLVMIELIF